MLSYASNFPFRALSTHGVTNGEVSPPKRAISLTTEEERYIFPGADMMKTV